MSPPICQTRDVSNMAGFLDRIVYYKYSEPAFAHFLEVRHSCVNEDPTPGLHTEDNCHVQFLCIH